MADRVGQLLGNYQLTKLLGRGGFAEVYLGKQIYLKTSGAIKLLHTKGASQKELDDFFKEAQAIAKLSHPNIVRVLEFGMEEKTPFLVMDYAPHGTLRQRHPRKTQVPLETVLAYVKQVAAALQYAHDADIIHRDVKPDNMLLARDGSIWLSDFGIALTAHSSTAISTQDAIGTIAYMAPEQFQGKPRRASDQYALALVVYEWLTGERPFHGSFAELGMQHIHAIPAPLREKVPTIGADVEKVVLRALAKDPQERYGSVEEFAKELERAEKASRVIELAPRYRKGLLRIPRRTLLKRVPQPEEATLTPALRASNQTETTPTTIQQARPEPIIQVRRGMPVWRIGLLVVLAALIVAIPFLYPMVASALSSLTPPAEATSIGQQGCGAAFSDDFKSTLHAGWVWVDPAGHGTYGSRSGVFEITAAGNSDLNATTNNDAPRLLQPIQGNFTVETQVVLPGSPPAGFLAAGLLLWQDNNNFLRLERSSTTFDYEQEVNGVFSHDAPQSLVGVTIPASQAELQLKRVGDSFTASWRIPGQGWQVMSAANVHFQNMRVGLFLVNESVSQVSVSYSYFRVVCS